MSAGRASRWLLSAIFLLSIPLVLTLFFWLFGPVFDDPAESPLRPDLLLLTSWLGLLFHSVYYYREWPARLRLLWLRSAGDRRDGWRRMERLLIDDAVQIVVLAAVIALAGRLFTGLPGSDLLIYVVACAATIFIAAYLTIWLRARRLRRLAEILTKLLTFALLVVLLFFSRNSGALSASPWLVPVLIAAAFAMRTLARNGMARVDWCVVRPELWRRPTGA